MYFVAPGTVIFKDVFRANPNLISVMTNEGAHSMDWLENRSPTSWSPKVLLEFVLNIERRQLLHEVVVGTNEDSSSGTAVKETNPAPQFRSKL